MDYNSILLKEPNTHIYFSKQARRQNKPTNAVNQKISAEKYEMPLTFPTSHGKKFTLNMNVR